MTKIYENQEMVMQLQQQAKQLQQLKKQLEQAYQEKRSLEQDFLNILEQLPKLKPVHDAFIPVTAVNSYMKSDFRLSS